MRHLLGLEDLSAADLTRILDAAEGYVGVVQDAGEVRGRQVLQPEQVTHYGSEMFRRR